jgi:hypothetical protein
MSWAAKIPSNIRAFSPLFRTRKVGIGPDFCGYAELGNRRSILLSYGVARGGSCIRARDLASIRRPVLFGQHQSMSAHANSCPDKRDADCEAGKRQDHEADIGVEIA